MDKLQEIRNKIETLQAKSVFATDLKSFATLFLKVLKESKDDFKSISDENKALIGQTLTYLEQEHDKLKDNVSQETDNVRKELKSTLAEVQKLALEVKSSIPKDGNDGLDGYTPVKGEDYFTDSEIKDIKDSILEQIPEQQNIEEIVKGINDLPTDNPELKISAKHIKDLPEQVVYRGGGISGIKEIIAGSNITVDNSNLGYPVISSTGGGSSTFLNLTDTPASYSGQTLKGVRVNAGETALEFYDTAGGTDEKVKYDASDPTAGYVADKIIAGTGISVAEGTGANENKLVITNTDKGSDVDLSGLVPYTGATGDVDLGLFDLQATDLTASGTLSVGSVVSDLTPQTDGTVSLGSTTNRYSTVATNTLVFDSDLSIGADTVGDDVYVETLTFSIKNNVSNLKAIFDTSSITTTDKTFDLPNASGTIALTSDIPAEADTLSSVTGRGASTSTESTFSGGIISNQTKANTSGGYSLKADNGDTIALFGAGSGKNATFYDGVKLDASTASRILSTDSNKNITALDTATYPDLTELSYIKGLTSAIQTQLNAKGVGDMVLASVQSVTGLKTFDTTKLAVKGSSTGTTAIASANAGVSNYTATLQAGTGTLAYLTDITGTNSGTNTGDQTITNSSDATSHTVTLSATGGSVQFIEGTNITLTTGGTGSAGTVTIAASGGGLTWSEVTGTSQSAAVDNGYIANNAGLVTITLPTTAAVGKIVRVAGKGAGLWRIAQNASEQIHFGSSSTTIGVGGYIEAVNRRDAVELICTIADTEWTVLSSIGNITIV